MKLFYEKYIKLAHIGKGANAHVYQVKHAELGYIRAIKTLNDYIESKSDRAYQSFLKECKTLLAIGNGAHPNIVRIYGPDLIDNHAIVEMDYIQGTTLDSYIKEKGFLDFDEVKTFIHDIVGALAYTHHDIYKFLMNPEEDDLQIDPNDGKKFLISPAKKAELVKKYGIAHNDLHSNNVMRRDYDGSFVLLDFGLAVQDGECVKSSRKSDGSPEYKAPEKFESGAITPRSDVYSLGVLIFEALTGRPPFVLDVDTDGKVSYQALTRICDEHHTKTPPSILPLRKEAFERQVPGAKYERDYPIWLDDVIAKCLAKNPDDRYTDAKELYDTILSSLDKEDITTSQEVVALNQTIDSLKKNISELESQLESSKAEWPDSLDKNSTTDGTSNKKWKVVAIVAMVFALFFGVITGINYWKMDEHEKLISQYEGKSPSTEHKSDETDERSDENDLQDKNQELQDRINSLEKQLANAQSQGNSQAQNSRDSQNEITSLNKQLAESKTKIESLNAELKKAKTQTQTKVEYKTPPSVEQELYRLRADNKRLKEQLTRALLE